MTETGGAFGLTVLSEVSAIGPDARRAAFVVRIDPPALASERAPLRLVLALDTSGSMAGDKLAAAQTSASAMVRALGPNDTFACVGFATRVITLIAPTTMTAAGKSLAVSHLARARAGGNTDLAGALLAALTLANAGEGGGRVLLLTDGCPTEGVTDPKQIETLARGAAGRSTLSTFGFGRDVNPLLLSAVADAGKGNYTFIETGEPPTLAIAGELGGILLTVAAGVSLSLRPAQGVRLHRVHRAGTRIGAGETSIELPPLVAEEPVYVAFELTWDDAPPPELATVSLQARRTDDGREVQTHAPVRVEVARAAGPFVPEAAKELLLALAAMAMEHASAAIDRQPGELAAMLAASLAELGAKAHAAGVSDDPQIAAALHMIDDARRGLLAASKDAQSRSRQDLVASAASVRGKRNTFIGKPGSPRDGSPFVTKSQLSGWRLMSDEHKKDDEPSS